MANITSGTTIFEKGFSIADIVEEAYERIGIEGVSGYQLKGARRSLNIMFQEWGNRGLHYWEIANNTISLVNGKNTFNTKHNHPNSYFSAAYYIKTNKDSGHIKFFDPKEVKTMYSPAVSELNEFSTNIVRIKPEEGKLLLFPSYLHHSVEENISDEDRIVISFNLDIK